MSTSQALKGGGIDPGVRGGRPAGAVVVELHAAGKERRELTQLAAEVAPATRFWFIAPQEVGQMRSIDRLVVTGQVSQQRQRFARLEGADQYSIPLDLDLPEQPQIVGRVHPFPF